MMDPGSSASVLLLRSSCEDDRHRGSKNDDGIDIQKLRADDDSHGSHNPGEKRLDHEAFSAMWEETISSSHFICDVFFVADIPVQYNANNDDWSNERRRRHLLLEDNRAVVKLSEVQLFTCGMENVLTISDPLESTYLVSLSNCHLVLSDDLVVPVDHRIHDESFRWQTQPYGNSNKQNRLDIAFSLLRAKQLFRETVSSNAAVDEDIDSEELLTAAQDRSDDGSETSTTSFGKHGDLTTSSAFLSSVGIGAYKSQDALIHNYESLVQSELENINRLLALLGIVAILLVCIFAWALFHYRNEQDRVKRLKATKGTRATPTQIVSVMARDGLTDMSPLSLDSGLAVVDPKRPSKKKDLTLSPCSKLQAEWSRKRKESKSSKKKPRAILKPPSSPLTEPRSLSPKNQSTTVTPSRTESGNERSVVRSARNPKSIVGGTASIVGSALSRVGNMTVKPRIVSPSPHSESKGGQSFIQHYWGGE